MHELGISFAHGRFFEFTVLPVEFPMKRKFKYTNSNSLQIIEHWIIYIDGNQCHDNYILWIYILLQYFCLLLLISKTVSRKGERKEESRGAEPKKDRKEEKFDNNDRVHIKWTKLNNLCGMLFPHRTSFERK